MRLRVLKIGHWWYIQHTGRMKYYQFKYYDEEQARDTFATLQESWLRNSEQEEIDVVDFFNIGMNSAEAAQMRVK